MDYRRLPGGPYSYTSGDDNEEHNPRNQTQTCKIKDDYMELDSQCQSTESTDVNFLEIAARFLGKSGMGAFHQFKGERRFEEIDPYLQYRMGMSSSDVRPEKEENIHASGSNYESCKINSENEASLLAPESNVQSSIIDTKKEKHEDSIQNPSERNLKRDLDHTNNEQVEEDTAIGDGYSHNSPKTKNEKKVGMVIDIGNKKESNDPVDESESHSMEDMSDTTDSDTNDESTTKDQETEVEKEIKKNLDSISVKYDTATQTYICLKVTKKKGKNQFVCKVNANRTDSSIAARELPYKCKFCDEAFSLFSQLKRHTQIHSVDSPFVCQNCGRIYQNEAELLKHAKKHNRPKPHLCVECGKGFRQLHMLENHVRTHNGEKPFLCETCGQGFGQKENLKLHERWHSDVKPHKCAVCGKQFNNTKCLHRHELTHSNERNYPCDICGKSYLRNDHLRRHKRSHGEEPRFKCSYCGKGFHQKVNVEEHERIHTGDRPFVCEVCGKGFTQRGNLKSHLIKHSFV